MRISSSTAPRIVLLFVALALVGCGKSGGGVSVHGHVAYRGQPLANGSVTFFPLQGRPVVVPLAPDGTYAAVLTPGDYDVVINVGYQMPPGWKEGDPVPPPPLVLPDQYTSRVRTSLHATVTANAADPIDFDLN